MTLADLYETLSRGYLRNLEVGMNGMGTIAEENWPEVNLHITEGLNRLFTRFVLNEKSLVLRMYDSITNYHLLPKYADSKYPDSGATYPYIMDSTEEPFLDDVLKILTAWNGIQLVPLNDGDLPQSVFTPQAKLIQVPWAKSGYFVTVGYQAKHPVLTGERDQDIEIPENMEGALLSYVASRIYTLMNTQENVVVGQMHMQNYETICAEVIQFDTANSSSTSSQVSKFRKGGWV